MLQRITNVLNKIRSNIYYHLVEKHFTSIFPLKPTSGWRIRARLNNIYNQLKKRNIKDLRGELYRLPDTSGVEVWKQFLDQNPNHLGTWTSVQDDKLFATEKLEKEVINQVARLLHADIKKLDGYITTGATEGNIFSAWLGRTCLRTYVQKETICLIQTDLTHYSIRKAADILDIPVYITPLDSKTWSIHISSLRKTLHTLYKKGRRGFLLPLTLGYTVGGANDDIKSICRIIETFLKEKKDAHMFVWIDAALSGLILPFINLTFSPFASRLIQSYLVDFHKLSGIPYPAGMILYRKPLRKLITRNIPYLRQKDNTLLGSRTGIAAVSVWAVIQSLGTQGFQTLITRCMDKKNQFLTEIKTMKEVQSIISDEESVQAAVVVDRPFPHTFCDKYGLRLIKKQLRFHDGNRTFHLYKLFFLP